MTGIYGIIGGFTDRDEQGLSYNVFNYMLGPLTIKSVIDLGEDILLTSCREDKFTYSMILLTSC